MLCVVFSFRCFRVEFQQVYQLVFAIRKLSTQEHSSLHRLLKSCISFGQALQFALYMGYIYLFFLSLLLGNLYICAYLDGLIFLILFSSWLLLIFRKSIYFVNLLILITVL